MLMRTDDADFRKVLLSRGHDANQHKLSADRLQLYVEILDVHKHFDRAGTAVMEQSMPTAFPPEAPVPWRVSTSRELTPVMNLKPFNLPLFWGPGYLTISDIVSC